MLHLYLSIRDKQIKKHSGDHGSIVDSFYSIKCIILGFLTYYILKIVLTSLKHTLQIRIQCCNLITNIQIILVIEYNAIYSILFFKTELRKIKINALKIPIHSKFYSTISH